MSRNGEGAGHAEKWESLELHLDLSREPDMKEVLEFNTGFRDWIMAELGVRAGQLLVATTDLLQHMSMYIV